MVLNLRGLQEESRELSRIERRKRSLQVLHAAVLPAREPILSESVMGLPIVLRNTQDLLDYNSGNMDAIGLQQPQEQNRAYRLGYLVGLVDFHTK